MSKYDPLSRKLQSVVGERVRFSFAEIEATLGFRLPDSARRYAPWWANTAGSHVQAGSWMSAGWRTCDVDVPQGMVSFERLGPNTDPTPMASVQEPGAPYVTDDAIVIRRDALRGGAVRMLEDYREAQGGSLADAAAALLNAMFVERRRQMLERFPLTGRPSAIDSTDLIREDRDAR
jgi:hypothetical protein